MVIHNDETSTLTGAVLGLGTGIMLDIETAASQYLGMSTLVTDVLILAVTTLVGGIFGYIGHEIAQAVHQKLRRKHDA